MTEFENNEKTILDRFPETKGTRLYRDKRKQQVLQLVECCNVPVLKFPRLESIGMIEHLFTTRAGGVSEGMFSTMNFSIKLGDDPLRVQENYKRIAAAMNSEYEDITGTCQTHTTNILRITEKDRGKAVSVESDYQDVDGLITDVPGITLAVYTADCVPIYFVDPVRKAIGLAHSGWRGTACDMAGKMVERMQLEFGCKPSDIVAAIGPSICRECYEVDQKVADAFFSLLDDCSKVLLPGKETGKYQLDLWQANYQLLTRAGVLPQHVEITDLCTGHNPKVLFSHRASNGKRGNLGAFLKIRE